MTETFRPIANMAPSGLWATILSKIRYLVDFQYHTVVRDIRSQFKDQNGILLDVGCGDSPYRHLLKTNCKYLGIDIKNQEEFGYQNEDIIYFEENGSIPLKDNSVDCIISTEVLEHVLNYKFLVDEIYRVVRPGGKIVITVPWSARFHYVPYDYLRFTPSMLKIMFKDFKKISIGPRGTDVTSICSKIMVICVTLLSPWQKTLMKKILIPLYLIVVFPAAGLAVGLGHLSLWLNIGSDADPLGYTIVLEK